MPAVFVFSMNMKKIADRIIAFNRKLHYEGALPEGIRIMNPFRENETILPVSEQFYRKFYNDTHKRILILGINPGRLGSGATGVPFTDTKRLADKCGITIPGMHTHEPSSVFMYDMIDAYGGVSAFYSDVYISSVCPLGFVKINEAGKEVNYNYYDSKALQEMVLPFIEWNLQQQVAIGCYTETCFCLGTGKNYKFLSWLNTRMKLFGRIVPLEHPRYIMQYKLKNKDYYAADYVTKLKTSML